MKPTLEEVKEYFKDAEIVECLFNSNKVNILTNVTTELYSGNNSYWIVTTNQKGGGVELWNEDNGFAKIITTKNTMKITKEFIRENKDKTIKEVFPDVCETKDPKRIKLQDLIEAYESRLAYREFYLCNAINNSYFKSCVTLEAEINEIKTFIENLKEL